MNRRRTAKRNLGFGSIVLLVAAAVVSASAGVFHAYIKNRQINVSRDIQRVEDLISQHELDIKTEDMLLAEQMNRFLIRDRLKEFSSDLRPIPVGAVREISAVPSSGSVAASRDGSGRPAAPPSASSPEPPSSRLSGRDSAVTGLAHRGP